MYSLGFVIKKMFTSLVQFPGILLAALASFSLYLFFRRRLNELRILIPIILVTYFFSCPYFANRFIASVEEDAKPYSAYSQCDVIILLGGGTEEGVTDLSGTTVPAAESAGRIVNTARLYYRFNIPILVTAGSPSGEIPEALVAERFLKELGIPSDMILTEIESLDTRENAKYCKEIMNKKGFRNAALVTSAFHMKRASLLFHKYDISHVGLTSNPLGETASTRFQDFLPSAYSMRKSSLAIKEYLGLVFYTLF